MLEETEVRLNKGRLLYFHIPPTGWVKTTEFILLQCGSQKSKTKVLAFLLEALKENLSRASLLASGDIQQPLLSLAWGRIPLLSASLSARGLHFFLCPAFPPSLRKPVIGCGPVRLEYDLFKTLFYLQKSCFQIRSHLQGLGYKISKTSSLANTMQSIISSYFIYFNYRISKGEWISTKRGMKPPENG